MSELISLLATSKQAGLDIGSMVSIVMIYFMLKKFVSKQNEEIKTLVSSQVDKIVVAIGKHNERLESLENDVKIIKEQINKG